MSSAVAAGRAQSLGTLEHAADATLADLYQSHSGWVLARCRASLRSREEAEDAMQVTFLQAFRALRRGVVPQHELAWLGTIADNVCRSRVRAAMRNTRREASVEQEVRCSESSVAIDEGAGEELAALKRALRRLPETQRRAILLREWAGMSTREIALELETSVTAVDMLLHRARRALSVALGESRWRRVLDLTWLLGVVRQLPSGGGGAAAKVAAAASAAVVATTGVAASAPDSAQVRSEPRLPRASMPSAYAGSAPAPAPTAKLPASTREPAHSPRVEPTPSRAAAAGASGVDTTAPVVQPSQPADGGVAPAAPAPAAVDPAVPEAAKPPVVQRPVAQRPVEQHAAAERPVVELPDLPVLGQLPEQGPPVELPAVATPIEPQALPTPPVPTAAPAPPAVSLPAVPVLVVPAVPAP